MNKKGFTLIELLAVVVILSIILVIAIPRIMNVIKNSKINSFMSTAKLVALSVENKYDISLTNNMLFSTTGSCMEMGNLDTKEYRLCSYKIINGKAYITLIGEESGKFPNYSCYDSTKSDAYCYSNRLPDGFKEKSYIESTGAEYIDTLYIAKENTWIHAKLYTKETGNKNWFGGSAYSTTSFTFNSFATNKIEFQYGNSSWTTIDVEGVVNKDFTVDYAKNKKIYINDVEIVDLSSYDMPGDSSNIYIFLRSNGTAFIKGKVYEFNIYEDNDLIMMLIPSVRISDNEVGMYDIISNKFFTNSGTGKFSTN